ncbi:MAG: hypothetical protein LBS27_05105 [Bifidobacteriaceae bacterium]|nr:hypothetical protein [Bifidobacteriaceae bacterium]
MDADAPALDQGLSAAALTRVAVDSPDLQVRVAWHRNVDRPLLEWLRDNGEPPAARVARVRLAARAINAARDAEEAAQADSSADKTTTAAVENRSAGQGPAVSVSLGDADATPASGIDVTPVPDAAPTVSAEPDLPAPPVGGTSSIRSVLSGEPLPRRPKTAPLLTAVHRPLASRIPRAVAGGHRPATAPPAAVAIKREKAAEELAPAPAKKPRPLPTQGEATSVAVSPPAHSPRHAAEPSPEVLPIDPIIHPAQPLVQPGVDPLLGDPRTPWPPASLIEPTEDAPAARIGITRLTTAEPATVKPTTAKPATAKPATAKPAGAKPATARPAGAKPAGARPAGGGARERSGDRTASAQNQAPRPTPPRFGPGLMALVILAVALLVACVVVGALMVGGVIETAAGATDTAAAGPGWLDGWRR